MSWTPPTEQEFNDRWATPEDAEATFGGGSDPRLDDYRTRLRVLDRLQAGILIAVARSGSAGSNPPRAMMRIPQRGWNQDYLETNDTFWKHGEVNLRYNGTTGYGDWTEFRFFDVRFDPASFNDNPRITSAADREHAEIQYDSETNSEISIATDRRNLPSLSDSLLVEWHRLFRMAYPNGNASQGEKSVKGMFPKHHISRKRIRELFPDGVVGRPLRTEK